MGLTIRRRGDPTSLFGETKERVEEQYSLIQHEGLSWWRNFTATSGPKFDGTMIDVFWMRDDSGATGGATPHVPYRLLRRAIKTVLSDTAATCRGLPLPPKRYVDEAAVLLEGLIQSVYNGMDRLERLLRGGLPKAGPDFRKWEIQEGTRKLTEYLKEQAAAAILLAGGGDDSNSSETKSLPALLREFIRQCDAWARSEYATQDPAGYFVETTVNTFSYVVDRLRCCHDDRNADMVTAKYYAVRDWLRSHADSPVMTALSCPPMSEFVGFCRNLADHYEYEERKAAPATATSPPAPTVLQGAPSGTLPADIHAKTCKTIRSRVDDLLIEHPWLWADFARHAEYFKACFVAWADFPATKRGMERASRPPCPSTWEIDDKTCCQYVTLGIIRDMVGGGQIDRPLVAHILSDASPRRDAYAFTAYLIAGPRNLAYTMENLERALQYVEQDIAKIAPQREKGRQQKPAPDKAPENETKAEGNGKKAKLKRPPVKKCVKTAMKANPKIHSAQILLPHVNELLKMAGFNNTTPEQVKKNMSVLKREARDAQTP
jgi:hypothetical protein